MGRIIVDETKCTKCGLCVGDCRTYSIEMGSNGYPVVA